MIDINGQHNILSQVDLLRYNLVEKKKKKNHLGQFFTPAPIAEFMAQMFRISEASVHLLDAGAGIGSLSAAFVDYVCTQKQVPKKFSITAYEIDASLTPFLENTLKACRSKCEQKGIHFSYKVINEDFVKAATSALRQDLFSPQVEKFNYAILNPPYKKIQSASEHRKLLRRLGIETSNLYTAFLAITKKLLTEEGQLVAITPRSFCNGPYFKAFRNDFLEEMALKRIHIFESRKRAFSDDGVLQENIIFHAIKSKATPSNIAISSHSSPGDPLFWRDVEYDQVIHPEDPDKFIHIITDEMDHQISEKMRYFQSTLEELGISVSTGRVVDFRANKFLKQVPDKKTVPLIYPMHFQQGFVEWPPKNSKKPHAIISSEESKNLLVPSGTYVLVRRFSSKEEKRRIVAAIYDPERIKSETVGFENHLNYFHCNGKGLPAHLAKGLAVFLNSMMVDAYFRLFNGHTQVNATDLRSLKYPSREKLESLGAKIKDRLPDVDALDDLIEQEVFDMANESEKPDPIKRKQKIEAALAILKSIGMPGAQQNERSALTLLALIDVKSEMQWEDANNPLIGITPIMNFAADHYGKQYAPNTRETVRRQTVHQFLDAGIIRINPDDPDRPTNSPHTVYQIEDSTLDLIRSYGSAKWNEVLKKFLQSIETLQEKYAQERQARKIPVDISNTTQVNLSPGGQNELVKKIIDDMFPNFAPDGKVIYLGDTASKFAYFDRKALEMLGVDIEDHGKMPDVVIHHQKKNWLLLIEAVTSHGPVDPKRRGELQQLFETSKAGLVFITTFLTRRDMMRYLPEISWETEVWIAESPTHMIHFDGERFLGPCE